MNIYQFMASSPFLTFFIFMFVCEMFCVAFRSLGGKYKCSCRNKELDKTEKM